MTRESRSNNNNLNGKRHNRINGSQHGKHRHNIFHIQDRYR
jgi:hypothetical protein